MSTFDGPTRTGGDCWCSLTLAYPARSHFQRTLSRKDWAKVRMNVAAHQDKEKKEKTGKRKAGKKRRQEFDFKEAVCCPFAVV